MRILKLKLTVLFLMICGLFGSVSAQMQPAKMLPPKVKREVKIKASANDVWNLIASLEKVEDYAPSLVKKSIADGHGEDAVREMEMVDGTTRLETVLIFAPNLKHICFIPFEDYMETKHLAVHCYVQANGPNKCKVIFKGYLHAKKGTSESKLIKQMGSEFSQTLKGLKTYFEK
ncbi:SRPBCC family protein [Ancylomarina sp. 16SWW S1-10-2]|uniref:SRPBCC family protein n=1 Tax=Ancylomarina sp. 16SWW S1-10-2 TaxID=2499681 RepID=UPI0012AE45E2|nr:SRPBCC family protein [Ancylomarina sp. 16SWW S1-10-2]MRT94663.1 SRPBCC family protein [Ancylomarina sp. 16SWW S1-10-2]